MTTRMGSRKNRLPGVRSARKDLENAVISGITEHEVIAKVLYYASAIAYGRAKSLSGSVIGDIGERGVWWVVYQDDYGEYLAEAYLYYTKLEEFSASPWSGQPEGTRLAVVNIFGLFNEFMATVAPGVTRLLDHGVNDIYYFGWNKSKNMYTKWDAADPVRRLLAVARNPIMYREHKRNLIAEKNGVLSIEDLVYLRRLREIGRLSE
jgi:hypothetical protein